MALILRYYTSKHENVLKLKSKDDQLPQKSQKYCILTVQS